MYIIMYFWNSSVINTAAGTACVGTHIFSYFRCSMRKMKHMEERTPLSVYGPAISSILFIELTGNSCSSAVLIEVIKTNINGVSTDSASQHNTFFHTDSAAWLNPSHSDKLVTILLVIVDHLASKYILLISLYQYIFVSCHNFTVPTRTQKKNDI